MRSQMAIIILIIFKVISMKRNMTMIIAHVMYKARPKLVPLILKR
jgi:hypothetical protein